MRRQAFGCVIDLDSCPPSQSSSLPLVVRLLRRFAPSQRFIGGGHNAGRLGYCDTNITNPAGRLAVYHRIKRGVNRAGAVLRISHSHHHARRILLAQLGLRGTRTHYGTSQDATSRRAA